MNTANSVATYAVKSESALFYESAYSCDNAVLISHNGLKFFITDGRYTIEAKEAVKSGVEVIEAERDLILGVRLLLRKLGIKRLDFDPFEFSYAAFSALSRDFHIDFKAKPHLSQLMRIAKTPSELAQLKAAAQAGADAFDELASFIEQNPSANEAQINYKMSQIMQNGGERELSFAPITAINANAAKAHALPSKTAIKRGDLLLVDAGLKIGGYCSDRTRTAHFSGDGDTSFSKSQKFSSSKQNEIYAIVLEAQEAAIKAVRPGALAKDIDAAAREVIKKAGFGEFFIHSTGHGVGLDIHELPVISPKNGTVIAEGMVFSVEPGIYLAGEFGVRIEDVVAVTSSGCEVL